MNNVMDVTPGLKTGRGLKHRWVAPTCRAPEGNARLKNRARIETAVAPVVIRPSTSNARLKNRARIETGD